MPEYGSGIARSGTTWLQLRFAPRPRPRKRGLSRLPAEAALPRSLVGDEARDYAMPQVPLIHGQSRIYAYCCSALPRQGLGAARQKGGRRSVGCSEAAPSSLFPSLDSLLFPPFFDSAPSSYRSLRSTSAEQHGYGYSPARLWLLSCTAMVTPCTAMVNLLHGYGSTTARQWLTFCTAKVNLLHGNG